MIRKTYILTCSEAVCTYRRLGNCNNRCCLDTFPFVTTKWAIMPIWPLSVGHPPWRFARLAEVNYEKKYKLSKI